MRSLTILAVLCATAAAQVKTEAIEYKDGDTLLEGFLAYDPALSSTRPGILVVHQWMGITAHEKEKAVELAKLGYVALCADIYGKGVRPKGFQEARTQATKYRTDAALFRSRLAAAYEALAGQVFVDKRKLAAIGFCFGGGGVLELARSGAALRGVVSFHGGLATKQPAKPGDIKAKVLVLHGADDPHVPPDEVAAFMKEMRGAKVDWQFVAYGGAVHAFTQRTANHDTAKYHADAARRSWQAMRQFFTEVFK